jgi:dihydrofolate reductase
VKLVVDEWMSLDGVVQSPTGPDEDASDGFTLGGWHVPYFEPAAQQWILDGIQSGDAYLFGRLTFGNFAAHWPHASAAEQVIAEPLNTRPKYVAASTEDLPEWANTTRLAGDVVDAVGKLRADGDGELHLIGSAALARTVLGAGLVDRLRLMIDPVVLGDGKRLFPTGDPGLRAFRLSNSVATPAGALLVTYDRVI